MVEPRPHSLGLGPVRSSGCVLFSQQGSAGTAGHVCLLTHFFDFFISLLDLRFVRRSVVSSQICSGQPTAQQQKGQKVGGHSVYHLRRVRVHLVTFSCHQLHVLFL